jgi:nitrile hydratase subunit beta
MNGGHDLGGMHGLGPIEAEANEPVFHADWEKRVFALVRATSALGCWTADMSRHARERQHPADYMRQSYYQNWLAGLEKLLVEKGLVTSEELASGKASAPATELIRGRVVHAENVCRITDPAIPTEQELLAGRSQPQQNRFLIGDRVRAVNRHPAGHTREPRYVRGRVGSIHACHGLHILPDLSAAGQRIGQPLYSVRFEAAELWGDAAVGTHAVVFADLWESYLEPA